MGRVVPLVLVAVLHAVLSHAGQRASPAYQETGRSTLARAAIAQRAGNAMAFAREMVAACQFFAYVDVMQAFAPCDTAVEASRAIANATLEAHALAFRAGLNSWRVRYDDGIADGERALALAGADDSVTRVARLALGAIHRERGDGGRAITFLRQSIDNAVNAQDRETEAMGRASLARTLFWLGDYGGARAEAERALAIGNEVDNAALRFFASWQLGMTELEAGRIAAALPSLTTSFELAVVIGHSAGEAMMAINLADAHTLAGDLARADGFQLRARTQVAEGRAPATFLPYVDEILGRIRLIEGRWREAAEAFSRATQQSDSAWLTVRAQLGLARARRAGGDHQAARRAYEATIKSIEEARISVLADAQRASYMATNGAAYRELIALLWDIGGAANAERAFDISEAGRARALLDALRAAGVTARPDAGPLPAARVRSLMTPGRVLIEYVQVEDRLFAFVVSQARVEWQELTLVGKANGLGRRVDFFRTLVQERSSASALVPAGRRLYLELLAPLVAAVPQAVTTLVVSPDGVLHALPFDALVEPEGQGRGGFVAQRFELVYTPSAALLSGRPKTAQRRASPVMLAVADPTLEAGGTMSATPALRNAVARPLPFSRREIAAAASALGGAAESTVTLSGRDASEAAIKRVGVDRFQIVHFATHAIVDEHLPLRSALLLTGGDGDDGLLQAGEIYGLTLTADLAVLSGCRTAQGRVLGGEGVQSLARAFLYAGAGAVVASLWETGDRSSVRLMEEFYRRLAAGDTGPGALASAKRAMIAAGQPPRSWAAFVAIGSRDAVRLKTPANQPAGLRLFWVVAILAVAGAWYWLVQKTSRGATRA